LNTTPVRQVNLQSLAGGTNIGNTVNVIFSRDGRKLYHLAEDIGVISQFSMSTPFDITTLTYDAKTLSFSPNSATACAITTTGNQFYISADNDDFIEYSLSTPFDISTATATGTEYALTEMDVPSKYNFSNDMTKLFASRYTGAIHEFEVTLG